MVFPWEVLYLKNKKLYKKGIFGLLSFVNYGYNKKFYKKNQIIKLQGSLVIDSAFNLRD